jgi:hypothetical protein
MAPKKVEAPEKKPLIGRVGTNLKVGIVGIPNVGKSTFFNVLTKSQAAAENFPFCTIDPNENKYTVCVCFCPAATTVVLPRGDPGAASRLPSFLTQLHLVDEGSVGRVIMNCYRRGGGRKRKDYIYKTIILPGVL